MITEGFQIYVVKLIRAVFKGGGGGGIHSPYISEPHIILLSFHPSLPSMTLYRLRRGEGSGKGSDYFHVV